MSIVLRNLRKKMGEFFENVESTRFSYEESVKNQIRSFIKSAGTRDLDVLEEMAVRHFIDQGKIEDIEESFIEEQAKSRVKGNLNLLYEALEDRERFHDQKNVKREYEELLHAVKIGVYSDLKIRYYIFAECLEDVLKELK